MPLRPDPSILIGHFFILPLIPEFIKAYPKISLDINLTDKVIDLLAENTDVALRTGPMKNSLLKARKLGETRMVIVASPDYLKANGKPKTPHDLTRYNLLRFNFSRMQKEWPFLQEGKKINIKPRGNIEISDGESMLQLVLNGTGLARLASFQVQNHIKAGRLVTVLENYNSGETEPLYAVFLDQGRFLPARIRVLIDFLVTRIRF